MAENPREVNPRSGRPELDDRPEGRDRTPAEIRQDIQRTRADIDRTLDTLSQELRPKRMLWHARKEIEPDVRAATDRVRESVEQNKTPLIAGAAAAAGLLALRTLVKRRKRKKRERSFPPEQKGF